VIRYLLDERLPLIQAAQCQHMKLQRLAGCGPWLATQTPEGIALTRGEANTWTAPFVSPLDGLRFQLADPLPAFRVQDFLRPNADQGNPVRLRCGHVIPVLPASVHDGLEIGLDGSFGLPAGEYARIGGRLYDRQLAQPDGQGIPLSDPDLIAFCRLALLSCTTLTAELVHAYKLLTTADLSALWDAGVGLPKADAGGAS
jgi:hypothetical protein